MIEYSTSIGDVNWLIFFALFLAATTADALFALYTFKVVAGKAFQAASLTMILYFIEVFGVLNFVNNAWYVLPLAFGAFLGTFVAVKREHRPKKRQAKKP